MDLVLPASEHVFIMLFERNLPCICVACVRIHLARIELATFSV